MTLKKIFDLARVIFIAAILIVLLCFTGVRLMKMQVVDGELYLAMSKSSATATQTVSAVRGEIVDRNGAALVENRASYNVIIEYSFFPRDKQEQNRIILEIAKILEADGLEWIDETPITFTEPYEYTAEPDSSAITRILSKLRLNSYATASNCIDKLIENYSISEEYTAREKRIIAGVRYQMILSDFSSKTDYVFIKPFQRSASWRILCPVRILQRTPFEFTPRATSSPTASDMWDRFMPRNMTSLKARDT